MKKFLIILPVFFALTLTSCRDKRIYNELNFALNLGIEASANKDLLITYTYPIISPQKTNDFLINSENAKSVRDFVDKTRALTFRRLELGKVQQLLFSKNIASEGGLHDFLEAFERDKTLSVSSYILIVDGSPKQLLSSMEKMKEQGVPGYLLNQLIYQNTKESKAVESRIYSFNTLYFAEGRDPMCPIIKIEDDSVALSGTALFVGDKMVGEVDLKSTKLLLAMMKKMTTFEYIFEMPSSSKDHLTTRGSILVKDYKRNLDISLKDNMPVVNINLDFNTQLLEARWDSIPSINSKEALEKLIATKIERDCNELIAKIKSTSSDPIGISEELKARYGKKLKNANWREMCKNSNINVNVKLNINSYGLIK